MQSHSLLRPRRWRSADVQWIGECSGTVQLWGSHEGSESFDDETPSPPTRPASLSTARPCQETPNLD
eukprot:241826-Hanusia_phi.AAC.1